MGLVTRVNKALTSSLARDRPRIYKIDIFHSDSIAKHETVIHLFSTYDPQVSLWIVGRLDGRELPINADQRSANRNKLHTRPPCSLRGIFYNNQYLVWTCALIQVSNL